MEDKLIIDLYINRNEEAINETDKKYGNYLSNISYNILYDQFYIEECKNDTYLKAWQKIPPLIPKKLRIFLGKIIRERSIDMYRKLHAEKRKETIYALSLDEINHIIGENNLPEKEVIKNELTKLIENFLLSLKEEDRDIFLMRYFYFDSIIDISISLDISQSVVKTRLFRIRKKLKDQLTKEGYI